MKLHLGVLDVPYSEDSGGGGTSATTGDVATILEDRYHIMELYYEEMGQDNVAKAFEESAKTAIEDMFSGKPMVDASYVGGGSATNFTLTADATQELEDAFRVFIDQKELDYVMPGVPTQASLKGINHRLKRPYVKSNPVRPSFRDTGLYQAAFRAWVEE